MILAVVVGSGMRLRGEVERGGYGQRTSFANVGMFANLVSCMRIITVHTLQLFQPIMCPKRISSCVLSSSHLSNLYISKFAEL
jgi:hypothetical protein